MCQFFGDFHRAKWVLDCLEFDEESNGTRGCRSYGQKRLKERHFSTQHQDPHASILAHLSSEVAETPDFRVSAGGQHKGATCVLSYRQEWAH